MTKAEMMAHFDEINTAGLHRDDLVEFRIAPGAPGPHRPVPGRVLRRPLQRDLRQQGADRAVAAGAGLVLGPALGAQRSAAGSPATACAVRPADQQPGLHRGAGPRSGAVVRRLLRPHPRSGRADQPGAAQRAGRPPVAARPAGRGAPGHHLAPRRGGVLRRGARPADPGAARRGVRGARRGDLPGGRGHARLHLPAGIAAPQRGPHPGGTGPRRRRGGRRPPGDRHRPVPAHPAVPPLRAERSPRDRRPGLRLRLGLPPHHRIHGRGRLDLPPAGSGRGPGAADARLCAALHQPGLTGRAGVPGDPARPGGHRGPAGPGGGGRPAGDRGEDRRQSRLLGRARAGGSSVGLRFTDAPRCGTRCPTSWCES